jgi:hypothetical protein
MEIIERETYTSVHLNLILRSWLLRIGSIFIYINFLLTWLLALGKLVGTPQPNASFFI